MDDTALTIFTILLFVFALVFWVISRLHTVRQGHVALVQRFGKHRGFLPAGLHFLWPFQTLERELDIQEQEIKHLAIPGIFTHGGLPLTVMLDYAMALNPEQMHPDDLYRDELARLDQQERIFKGILQRLVREAPRPQEEASPNRVNTALLFSPFLGQSVAQLRDGLEQEAAQQLAAHGIRLAPGSLLISWLQLPQPIIEAYTGSLSRGFTSASLHEFISRVRDAGLLSDAALVQLMHAVEENPASLSTIFTAGGFQPEMRADLGDFSTRIPTTPSPATPEPPPTEATEPRPGASGRGVDRSVDLPLTEEDMALLRSLVD